MPEPNEQPDEEREPTTAEPTPEEQEALEREHEPTPEGEPTEGESTEGEQGAPGEPTEASAEPHGLSEREIEERFKKLDAERNRHAKRIGEILGEDAQELLVCELCWPPAPGFRFPMIEEAQKSAVMTAIGFAPEPELQPDKHSSRCPDCAGWGKVATGSRVEEHKSETCKTCNAFGWVGPRAQRSAQQLADAWPKPPANGPAPVAPSDLEREAVRQAAIAAGFMLTDTRAPATA